MVLALDYAHHQVDSGAGLSEDETVTPGRRGRIVQILKGDCLTLSDPLNAPPAMMQPATEVPSADRAAEDYRHARVQHWDRIARQSEHVRGLARYYHRRLSEVYRFVIPPGRRVLELGCGRGELLASLQPGHGVGVDISPEMIAQARRRHPQLTFIQGDALDFALAAPSPRPSRRAPGSCWRSAA